MSDEKESPRTKALKALEAYSLLTYIQAEAEKGPPPGPACPAVFGVRKRGPASAESASGSCSSCLRASSSFPRCAASQWHAQGSLRCRLLQLFFSLLRSSANLQTSEHPHCLCSSCVSMKKLRDFVEMRARGDDD